MPGVSNAGLFLSRQDSAAADVTVPLFDIAISDLWSSVTRAKSVQDAVVAGIRACVREQSIEEAFTTFEEHGLAKQHVSAATRIAKGESNAARVLLQDLTRPSRSGLLYEELFPLLQLIEYSDQTPTIVVHIESDWLPPDPAVRRSQREDVCALLAILAQGCEVRIVGTGPDLLRLVNEHRTDLPRVSDEPIERWDDPQSVAEQAWTAIGSESRELQVLRDLKREPSETLSYHALISDQQVSDSRIRQVIGRLTDHDCVRTYASSTGKVAELTTVGHNVVQLADEQIGRQQSLQESVSDPCKSTKDVRVTPREHVGGEEPVAASDRRATGLASTSWMGRADAQAAVASCCNTDFGIVDHPVERRDDPREGTYSYDPEADRVVIGIEYRRPLQWVVTAALTLADFRTFDTVIDADRLDADLFADTVDREPWFLRGTSQLGYLKDADANGQDYIDAIRQAAADLQEATRKIEPGEYSDEQRDLRQRVMREAHGLLGTLTYILDLCGVDLVREVRIPQYNERWASQPDQIEQLLTSLVKASTIASHYKGHVAERHLFDPRPDRRQAVAWAPDPDPTDYKGELIGAWAIVGQFGDTIDEFQRRLENALSHPDTLQEDDDAFAPFVISVDIEQGDSRDCYDHVTKGILEWKQIDFHNGATRWLHALTGSIYDAAEALAQLGSERYRTVECRDLEYALAQLDPDRLLPDVKPTVGRILSVLLRVDRPLSKREIATHAAGPSTSAVYRSEHWAVLEELGIVQQTADGWIVTITLPTDRDVDIPAWWRTATVRDLLAGVYHRLRVRGADPPPINQALTLPPDREELLARWPWIEGWLTVLGRLCEQLPDEPPSRSMVRFGASPAQATVQQSVIETGQI